MSILHWLFMCSVRKYILGVFGILHQPLQYWILTILQNIERINVPNRIYKQTKFYFWAFSNGEYVFTPKFHPNLQTYIDII